MSSFLVHSIGHELHSLRYFSQAQGKQLSATIAPQAVSLTLPNIYSLYSHHSHLSLSSIHFSPPIPSSTIFSITHISRLLPFSLLPNSTSSSSRHSTSPPAQRVRLRLQPISSSTNKPVPHKPSHVLPDFKRSRLHKSIVASLNQGLYIQETTIPLLSSIIPRYQFYNHYFYFTDL